MRGANFARRPLPQLSRGRIAAAAGSGGAVVPPDPVAIFGASNIISFKPYEPSLYTLTGQGYSSLVDAGTLRALTLTQATDARRPRQSMARGTACMNLSSSGQWRMNSGVFAVFPGAFTVVACMRSMAFAASTQVVWSGGSGTCSIQVINGRDLRMNAGTNQTSVGAVQPGELFTGEFYFNGANSEMRKNGGAPLLSGVNVGANPLPTEFYLGSSATLSSHEEGDMCEIFIVLGAISPAQRAAYQAWFDYKFKTNESQRTIMFVGDSNWLSNGSVDGVTTVRSLLWETFRQSKVGGYWIHPIGNFRDGTYSGDRHQATSGIGVDALTTQLATLWGTGFFVPDFVYPLCINADTRNLAPASYVPEPDASSTLDRWAAMISAMGAAGVGVRAIRPMSPKNFPPAETTGNGNIANFMTEYATRLATIAGTYPRVGAFDLQGQFPYAAGNYATAGTDEHWNETGKAAVAALVLADLAAA